MFISNVRWGFTNAKTPETGNFTINSHYIVVVEQLHPVEDPTIVRIVFHDNDTLTIKFKNGYAAESFIQQISND